MDEGQMVKELEGLLGSSKVRSGQSQRRVYDCDAYPIDRYPPVAAVFPESTEEVSRIVQWCLSRDVPYTPRGAGTGLSGGAMPAMGGVVLLTKRLNKILELRPDKKWATVQCGVANLAVSKAAEPFGLHFAPDPSSQTVSTIGGNIAENAGGPHTLKYGVTAQHVLGFRAVLTSGETEWFDLKEPGPAWGRVWIGSEGLLGIVTEAKLKLTPNPAAWGTLLISFSSIRDASRTVSRIIQSGVLPSALEMMDRNILNALHQAFGLDFHAETAAMLLVECDGDPDDVDQEVNQVVEIANVGGSIEVRRAATPQERKEFWNARKKGVGAIGRLAPSIVTHDGVIPPSMLPEILDFVYVTAASHGVGVVNLFHAGDGNLHPCFYFDDRDPKQVEAVVQAGEEIMRKCVEVGGSLTGEHGIGVEKVSMLKLMFTEEDLSMQRKVRDVFGFSELCNPCKLMPDQRGCAEHALRWKGAAT